ncbi:unnamed protein product, partial [Ilex paraguariensis]
KTPRGSSSPPPSQTATSPPPTLHKTSLFVKAVKVSTSQGGSCSPEGSSGISSYLQWGPSEPDVVPSSPSSAKVAGALEAIAPLMQHSFSPKSTKKVPR